MEKTLTALENIINKYCEDNGLEVASKETYEEPGYKKYVDAVCTDGTKVSCVCSWLNRGNGRTWRTQLRVNGRPRKIK